MCVWSANCQQRKAKDSSKSGSIHPSKKVELQRLEVPNLSMFCPLCVSIEMHQLQCSKLKFLATGAIGWCTFQCVNGLSSLSLSLCYGPVHWLFKLKLGARRCKEPVLNKIAHQIVHMMNSNQKKLASSSYFSHVKQTLVPFGPQVWTVYPTNLSFQNHFS